ncbi:acyltransferase family protein [Urbifossiella limnaea]|uniref:Acyltransferase family protein n=1 Tax=Urbifossiella limnaea TaxID=2528023 RepID=A0A517XN07_9BACT|nr:acyltransferase [Urbifossiella limnaea]QDU18891.1 Acyltransferase family protein [Urbifossiella limnaea]
MRFNNIQVLRLVAAVAVVVYHLGHYAQHTFGTTAFPAELLCAGNWMSFPVPLFFAVSGFVLTQAAAGGSAGRFLWGRALRLYPGYWVAVLLVMGLMWFTVWPPEYRRYVRPENLSWFLLPSEPGTEIYPLGVEWTLVYETALYLWVAATVALFGARRGLPVCAAVWAVLLLAKAAVWPDYAAVQLPRWSEVPFSVVNLSFVLGVLVYQVRDRGRRWRWPVLLATAAWLATVPPRTNSLEGQWLAFAPAAAALVWLAVQLPQLASTNRLVRWGEYSYGVYLLHAPAMMGTFFLLMWGGWLADSSAAVLLAGVVALAAGFGYGRLECALYARVRPLAKVNPAAVLRRARLALKPKGASRVP